jgi:alpha-ribazole phosphatase
MPAFEAPRAGPSAPAHDLLLLRHPQAVAPPGHCWGRSDLPLLAPMQPSVAQVWAKLQPALAPAGHPPPQLQGVVCSPLQRALGLAQPLAAALACACHTDARWLELSFGDWEGRPWDDISRAQSDPWAEDPWHRAPPGGETQAALLARVAAACNSLLTLAAPPGGAPVAHRATVVVAHAGPIRAWVAHVLGWPPARMHELPLAPGGLAWLRHRPELPQPWQVLAMDA